MSVGGSLNKEGLVFGYDSDNTFQGGEPTTNLVPSPQHNANFTTSNGCQHIILTNIMEIPIFQLEPYNP